MTSVAAILLFLLSGLPLLAYPAVLLAGVMTLGGHRPTDTDRTAQRAGTRFVWSTLLYPAVYGTAMWACYHQLLGLRLSWALLPFLHLAMVAILFRLWGLSERRQRRKGPRRATATQRAC